jgi:D-mannonate dehydratase
LEAGWGVTTGQDKLWDYEELAAIKRSINQQGLVWEAIENLDPAHWYDVLLDGPRKRAQLENLKVLLRTLGRVGVPILGYNFSIAGVWGWTRGPFGRGGAVSVGFDADRIDVDRPIPNGMVWNMTYDPQARPGSVPKISSEELWQRLADFLKALDRYSRQGKICYVHCRNVRGKVPRYQEVFIDEGDLDVLRVTKILAQSGYEGVIIPDHSPEMTCAASWHAGMAFALGYLRAAIQAAYSSRSA